MISTDLSGIDLSGVSILVTGAKRATAKPTVRKAPSGLESNSVSSVSSVVKALIAGGAPQQ
jgi:hypothetical protein